MPNNKEKISSEEKKTEREVEAELDKEEELEELYGDSTTDTRARKKHKERFGPTGGTRAAQKDRVEACDYYVHKPRKKKKR